MVCKIGGQLGTKVVISALGMLALYMRFNGTGICGGETLCIVSTLVVYTLCMHTYGRPLGIDYRSLFQYVLRRSFSRSFWLV